MQNSSGAEITGQCSVGVDTDTPGIFSLEEIAEMLGAEMNIEYFGDSIDIARMALPKLARKPQPKFGWRG